MNKRKILIGSTNVGKIKEIREFYSSQPFEFVTLQDLGITEGTEEPFDTVELNAYQKAKFYAEKTGLPTIADDGGLYIDALDGWPGVHAARIAPTREERIDIVLEKMRGKKKRQAKFLCAIVFSDPESGNSFISTGETMVEVTLEPSHGIQGFGYDAILYHAEKQKTFAEMSAQEKSEVSHRGKALSRMEYILKKQYGAKNIVVPCALVIKDGKMLMILRNDPQRPEYHKRWEFPGGGVEFKEQIIENVIRETKEETGLEVEPLKSLQHIAVEWQEFPTFAYQVYLIPHVCKIVGGSLAPRDQEVLDARWFELDEVTQYPLVGENADLFNKILPELRETISKYNL